MMNDFFSNRLFFRQRYFAALLSLFAGLLAPQAFPQSIDDVTLNVYKSETCGCCQGWIGHMSQHNYTSKVFHPADLNGVKEELGIKPQWQSCHTAVTANGYVFEGHIPARFISRFLANPPDGALGLTVPGMPVGAPGMEMGKRFTPYNILLMKQDGSHEVYASIEGAADQ